jgi:hypothetical protein
LGTGFFVHHRIVSAFQRVEFVSDRMSYTSERLLVLLLWLCMHQVRRKVMIKRTVFMNN